MPTAPTTYRVADMLADPIRLNSRLGTYTNFFNLLGLSGIAVPAGFRADGMPFGVTLAAPGFCAAALEPIAERPHSAAAGGHIGIASWRESVYQSVYLSGVAFSLKKK